MPDPGAPQTPTSLGPGACDANAPPSLRFGFGARYGRARVVQMKLSANSPSAQVNMS